MLENGGVILRSTSRSFVKVKERKCKKVAFRAYFRQMCIDFRKTRTEMIISPFYTMSNAYHQRKLIIFSTVVCFLKPFFAYSPKTERHFSI